MEKLTLENVSRFMGYLREEEKSPSTIQKYQRDILVFMDWTKNRDIDKGLVIKYKEYLLGNYAPASVNSVLSSLNSFFEYSGEHKLKVKMLKIQRSVFLDKSKELTRGEYTRLLETASLRKNKRLYYIMQTLCSTGIRISELKYITLEAVRQGRSTIRSKGKLRTVILPDRLCKMLKKYAEKNGIKSGSIFVTKNGNPLDRSNIWSDMKKLCKSAGVSKDKVFPHNLRHLFARTFYSVQKDIARLADILGHTSINTTRIYTMETGEIHKRQIQELGLLLC